MSLQLLHERTVILLSVAPQLLRAPGELLVRDSAREELAPRPSKSLSREEAQDIAAYEQDPRRRPGFPAGCDRSIGRKVVETTRQDRQGLADASVSRSPNRPRTPCHPSATGENPPTRSEIRHTPRHSCHALGPFGRSGRRTFLTPQRIAGGVETKQLALPKRVQDVRCGFLTNHTALIR